jgi:hypothetical protein
MYANRFLGRPPRMPPGTAATSSAPGTAGASLPRVRSTGLRQAPALAAISAAKAINLERMSGRERGE